MSCSRVSASSATRCCWAARASGKASTSLLAARLEHLRAAGGNPFFEVQVPQAAIALKQGAGRLIRTETDRGVLMIGDPRLIDKPYGRRIWKSLPPMRRTRELAEVEAFFGK